MNIEFHGSEIMWVTCVVVATLFNNSADAPRCIELRSSSSPRIVLLCKVRDSVYGTTLCYYAIIILNR